LFSGESALGTTPKVSDQGGEAKSLKELRRQWVAAGAGCEVVARDALWSKKEVPHNSKRMVPKRRGGGGGGEEETHSFTQYWVGDGVYFVRAGGIIPEDQSSSGLGELLVLRGL